MAGPVPAPHVCLPEAGVALDPPRGRLDVGGVAPAGLTGRALDGARDADRRDHGAGVVAHGGTHRCDAGLALPHALDPRLDRFPFDGPEEDLAGGPTHVQWERGAHGDDRAQAVGRLERGDADPAVTVTDVELRALARGVAQG